MVSHLFYSQLALLALIWLFLMVHVTWPTRGVTPPPASAQPEPLPPKRTRAHEPKPSGQGHSVFQCNPDQVQGCPRLRGETSAGCRHVGIACPAHEPNHCVAQRRHDLRDVATPYLGGSCWIPGSWMCR